MRISCSSSRNSGSILSPDLVLGAVGLALPAVDTGDKVLECIIERESLTEVVIRAGKVYCSSWPSSSSEKGSNRSSCIYSRHPSRGPVLGEHRLCRARQRHPRGSRDRAVALPRPDHRCAHGASHRLWHADPREHPRTSSRRASESRAANGRGSAPGRYGADGLFLCDHLRPCFSRVCVTFVFFAENPVVNRFVFLDFLLSRRYLITIFLSVSSIVDSDAITGGDAAAGKAGEPLLPVGHGRGAVGLFGLFSPNVGKLKEKRNVPGLALALEDKDPKVQYPSAEALGDLGTRKASFPLFPR